MNLIDFSSELDPLKLRMQFHSERQAVLSTNLANSNTPGFRPHDLNFRVPEAAPDFEQTNVHHLAAPHRPPHFESYENAQMLRQDGNGVDLENTQTNLMHNRIQFETTVEIAKRRLQMLRMAAGEGS